MLAVGCTLYIWIPEESKHRLLHAGRVRQVDAESFVAEFDEPLAPAAGSNINVYSEVRGRFMQQGARIRALLESSPRHVIAFERVGEVVSAESRGTYRASVAAMKMQAKVGAESGCAVVDVSPEGLGVVTRKEHALGSLEKIELEWDGQRLCGEARIQTRRTRQDGSHRYGLMVLEKGGPMRRGLEQLSSAVQRMQLRRLSRSA